MTREEAIKHLLYDWFSLLGGQLCVDADNKDRFCEAIGIAVTALRGQRTPAKLDRRRWEGCVVCNGCGADGSRELLCGGVNAKYCPFCGRPLTEEAWAELERRMNSGSTDN